MSLIATHNSKCAAMAHHHVKLSMAEYTQLRSNLTAAAMWNSTGVRPSKDGLSVTLAVSTQAALNLAHLATTLEDLLKLIKDTLPK